MAARRWARPFGYKYFASTENSDACREFKVIAADAITPRISTRRHHMAVALPDGWQSLLERLEIGDPVPPDLSRCTDIPDVPSWLVKEATHAGRERVGKPGPLCAANLPHPSVDGLFMPSMATFDGNAHAVPRFSCEDLSPREFYWRFVRLGMPVVFANCWDTDHAWWTRKAANLTACAEKRSERLFQEQGGKTPENCDIYTQWCKDMVQVISHDPNDRNGGCNTAAEMDAEHLPRALRFQPPLSGSVLENQAPYILSTPLGKRFGGPWHFDSACMGSLSVQYSGRKRWDFWAPWDLGTIRAHQRFETEVGPGDILVYGPAWFHSTLVVSGHSVAAAYYSGNLPHFGVLRSTSSLALSPLGFGACTGEGPSDIAPASSDWFERSAVWDALLQPGLQAYQPELPGASVCEPWCESNTCHELNGDSLGEECGGCDSTSQCHPEAEEWPAQVLLAE